jgi:quinol monooxygenase YgiN
MAIRLIVTFTAAPGRGAELAQFYKTRCAEARKEPGCEQFECFQSIDDPDKVILLERWKDQAALDVHARANSAKPPPPAGLRIGGGEREDYEYNRTR